MNDTLKTIDALPDLLPCPFCGEWPDRIKDYGVHCLTGDCGMYLKLMNIRDWNRRAASVDRITGNMNLEKGGKRMIDLEKRAKAWDEFSGEAREFTIGDTFNSAYELGVRDGAASVPKWTRVEDSQRAITIIDEILPFYTDARTDTRSWGVLRALETVRQRIMEGRGNDSGNNDDQTIRR